MNDFIKRLIAKLEEEDETQTITTDRIKETVKELEKEDFNIRKQWYLTGYRHAKRECKEVIDELELYTVGRLNTQKVEISVLQLQRCINKLKERQENE